MYALIMDHLVEIIGVLAILAAIWISLTQRKKKNLSYEIISNIRLLEVENDLQKKVKVLYEGSEVKNVHLLTLRFTNNGNQPIDENDYVYPIKISFNANAVILTDEIIDEEPGNLGLKLWQEENVLSLSPLLLNSKDAFSVKALIGDFEGFPIIDGRIKGVKSISERKGSTPTMLLISFALITGGLLTLSWGQYIFSSTPISNDIVSGGLIGCGYAVLLMAVYKRARNKLHNIINRTTT